MKISYRGEVQRPQGKSHLQITLLTDRGDIHVQRRRYFGFGYGHRMTRCTGAINVPYHERFRKDFACARFRRIGAILAASSAEKGVSAMLSFLNRANKRTLGFAHDSEMILAFYPGRIISGIVYHLLDEQCARAVDKESCAGAVQVLSHRMEVLNITRIEWALMSNVQRLRWLLDQARVEVKCSSDGLAFISAR